MLGQIQIESIEIVFTGVATKLYKIVSPIYTNSNQSRDAPSWIDYATVVSCGNGNQVHWKQSLNWNYRISIFSLVEKTSGPPQNMGSNLI